MQGGKQGKDGLEEVRDMGTRRISVILIGSNNMENIRKSRW